MNDTALNIVIGLASGLVIMIAELVIIKIFVDRFISQRERILWLPFRTMFYSAVYRYYDELLRIWELWNEQQGDLLKAIHSRGHLLESDIESLKQLFDEIKTRRLKAKNLFHNDIQTCTPSLTPETGPLCHEPMYFDEIIELYTGECERVLESFDPSQLTNNVYVDNLLKTIWSKCHSMNILMFRFGQFPNWFEKKVAETEGLYLYRGSFVPKPDFDFATRSDAERTEFESSMTKIPRTAPVLKFFDSDFFS